MNLWFTKYIFVFCISYAHYIDAIDPTFSDAAAKNLGDSLPVAFCLLIKVGMSGDLIGNCPLPII